MNIVFDHVTKRFGDKKILEDFSFTLPLTGITALMGPSGIGKTTLLRLMTGLEKADRGTVTGCPAKYSFLFQENRLLPFETALENAALVSDPETAARWLNTFSLSDEQNAYPKELSGGMQRRVALARAFAYPGELLILDEPLKGLDDRLRQEIFSVFLREKETRPILLVTHDTEEARRLNAEIYQLSGQPLQVENMN